MKILISTYYYDFARYFVHLNKEFSIQNNNVEINYISLYPSANQYYKKNNCNSILLYKEIKKIKVPGINKIVAGGKYKDILLSDCIQFNLIAHKMYGINSEKKLKVLAVKYIEYFDLIFKNGNYDIFISQGDTRIYTEIALKIAEKYNVKIWHMEQGPFGTMMFDNKGVNNNISYQKKRNKNLNDNEIKRLNTFIKQYHTERTPKFSQRNLFHKLDLLFLYPPFFLRKLLPIDLQTGESFYNRIFKKRIVKLKEKIFKPVKSNLPKKFITLILQVPVDAQMISNSPLYQNFYDMLIDVYNSIPKNYKLVVREHPQNLGGYEKRIYQFINNNSNVELINDIPLSDVIRHSELIILNNSTVGMEALTYKKPVVTLGEAYYNIEGIVYNLKQKKDLDKIINKALLKKCDEKQVEIFLYDFIFDYLYLGHYQDLNIRNTDLIVKDILEDFNKVREAVSKSE